MSSAAIQRLMANFTSEISPRSAAKVAHFGEHLAKGSRVYVTFLPGSDFDDTLALAKRLREEGFVPVPHIAARSLPSLEYLEARLARLVGEAGVDSLLCIGGGVASPLGPFSETMQLLRSGIFERHGIRQIGVAGHPEGSPDIPQAEVWRALADKNAFAQESEINLYLVTQFTFTAAPIIAWDQQLKARGNQLPVVVGLPGLATLKTLLRFGSEVGVGNSLNFIRKQAGSVAKLMQVSTPDVQLRDLADYLAATPESFIKGIHLYPLGGLRRSAVWARAVQAGDFTLNARGGFKVTVDYN